MHTEKTYFLFLLLSIVALMGVLHIFGINFFLYWRFLWFDIIVHILGGIFIGGVALWIFYFSKYFKIDKSKEINVFLISLITVLVAGIFWEIFEFNIGATLLADIKTYRIDTMVDMISNIFGAIIISLYFIYKNYLTS